MKSLLTMFIVSLMSLPALAETSIECAGAKASLVLPDRGPIEFRAKIGMPYQVLRIRETKPNRHGYATAVEVTVDRGTSLHLKYEFAELNRCEDDTVLRIYETAPVGAPRLLKTVSCTCAQS